MQRWLRDQDMRNASAAHAMLPLWDQHGLGVGTLGKQVVRLDLRADSIANASSSRHNVGMRLFVHWGMCIPLIGRSWWKSASWAVLLRFRAWVQARALDFLLGHGIRMLEHPSDTASVPAEVKEGGKRPLSLGLPPVQFEPFVVVTVRHGGKGVEEKLVQVSYSLHGRTRTNATLTFCGGPGDIFRA